MNRWTHKYIFILAALAAVIFIVAGINYRITQHIVEKTIASQQEDLAVKAANTVEMWLDQQMKILTATSDSVNLADLGQNEETMKPLKMAMKAGHFTDVYIGKKDGVLIDGADWLPSADYDPRNRPWYRRAVEVGGISFTTPYIDLVTNKLVIALVKPLVVDGETVGVMGADTVLDSLVQSILSFKVSETGYGFIVERNGTILVHPNQGYVMREKLQDIEKDLGNKLDSFASGNIGTVTYLGKDRQNHVLSFSLIANSDWFICVTAPRDEAYSLSRKTTMIFATEVALRVLAILALIALVGVCGSGLVLFLFSKRYSSAILQHKKELTGINKDLEWNIIKRKEVETYYQTLFNVANDAILISKDGRITECNHKTLDVFGFSEEMMLGKSMLDISPIYQQDGVLSGDKLREIMQDSLKGEQQVIRWSFIRADGLEFPASMSLKIFRLGDEELTLSSIRDISKRVDAEGQLMQAQKMAAVGEMLAIIAHQWRQPLNTLSTYISSLQAAQYNDMLDKTFVEKLVSGAGGQIHFMSKTIDDFRNFFKPSKSKGPVDVLEVIISAVKLMEAQMKHGGISLTVNNKTDSSSLMVFGYRGEFVHVLVNIIANAKDAIIQHTGEANRQMIPKTIEITVSTEQQTVLIMISDSGSGIPEHLMLQIFNPYFTTKGASSGTGMGLYMSKMIVEKEMNGELLAENSGSGAKFTIKLKKMSAENSR